MQPALSAELFISINWVWQTERVSVRLPGQARMRREIKLCVSVPAQLTHSINAWTDSLLLVNVSEMFLTIIMKQLPKQESSSCDDVTTH